MIIRTQACLRASLDVTAELVVYYQCLGGILFNIEINWRQQRLHRATLTSQETVKQLASSSGGSCPAVAAGQ
jgi:hypothetical protein